MHSRMLALYSDTESRRPPNHGMESTRQAVHGLKVALVADTAELIYDIKRACHPYFAVEAISLHRKGRFESKNAFENAAIILVEWSERVASIVHAIAHKTRENKGCSPIIALCDPKGTAGLQALLTGADYAVKPPVDASLLYVMMAAYQRRSHNRSTRGDSSSRIEAASQEAEDQERNGQQKPAVDYCEVGPLVVDERSRSVHVNGEPLNLTERPFDLLCYLARRAGECCTREQILREVWGLGFNPSTNVVDVQVYALRNALRPYGMAGAIQTVRGYGYRLQDLD